MYYVFYDTTTGVINRISEGVKPEWELGEGEKYFSSSAFLSPDSYRMDLSGNTPTLVAKTKPVVDVIAQIRSTRNKLLTATDWTSLPDAPLSATLKTEAIAYRQALRDMMDLDPPVFPEKPEWL